MMRVCSLRADRGERGGRGVEAWRAASVQRPSVFWRSLAFPQAAQPLSIHSFTPADVTLGTRLVIKGDFRS